jgi:GT2 family glycosyltransferase
MRFQDLIINLEYIIEDKIGLSNARNKAIENANSEFIAFLDDDCYITETYLDRLIWLIEHVDFDCLGGMYLPKYYVVKPKWIDDDFGKMKKLNEKLSRIDDDYVAGGNMIFQKNVFQKVGVFPNIFGMIGDYIGYGEEDYLQEKIRRIGGSIFFDPELIVYHTVQKYKLSLGWQLKSTYKSAKASIAIHRKNYNIFGLLFQFFKSILATFIYRIPIGMVKVVITKSFYWQNYILYAFKPVVINYGKIYYFITGKL